MSCSSFVEIPHTDRPILKDVFADEISTGGKMGAELIGSKEEAPGDDHALRLLRWSSRPSWFQWFLVLTMLFGAGLVLMSYKMYTSQAGLRSEEQPLLQDEDNKLQSPVVRWQRQVMSSFPADGSRADRACWGQRVQRDGELLFNTSQFGTNWSQRTLLTPQTGCRIARWVFAFNITKDGWKYGYTGDCGFSEPIRDLRFQPQSVLANDTVYVELNMMTKFAQSVLPHIRHPFVLISGSEQLPAVSNADRRRFKHKGFSDSTAQSILYDKNVLHWFVHNPWMEHPKLSSFPYGLRGRKKREISSILEAEMAKEVVRDGLLFVSFIAKSGSAAGFLRQRQGIPSGPKRSPADYLHQMHRHKYVLSPNGDRPECYRHYEALAVGTVPVTQLDPRLYPHLLLGGVVFAMRNEDYNATDALVAQLEGCGPWRVNARMVYEAFWMDYLEAYVGAPLRFAHSRRA